MNRQLLLASATALPAAPATRELTGNELLPLVTQALQDVFEITDGELVKGVHVGSYGATTQSLVMRSKSGTVRLLNARHQPAKLRAQGAEI